SDLRLARTTVCAISVADRSRASCPARATKLRRALASVPRPTAGHLLGLPARLRPFLPAFSGRFRRPLSLWRFGLRLFGPFGAGLPGGRDQLLVADDVDELLHLLLERARRGVLGRRLAELRGPLALLRRRHRRMAEEQRHDVLDSRLADPAQVVGEV